MKTIWKFPLPVTDFQKIEMPKGAEVLSAQVQGVSLCLWAMVDPEAETELRGFWIIGTGHPIEHEKNLGRFIGTTQMYNGSLIWHVFEHRNG